MQASTSTCAWQCARSAFAVNSRSCSRASASASAIATANPTVQRHQRHASSTARNHIRKLRKSKVEAPPSPNALPFNDAIKTLKALSPSDQTSALDLVILSKLAATVNINSLRGRAFLPHDASNSKKKEIILVFAEGDYAEQARKEGADIIGGKELIDEIASGAVSPTKIIAAPDQLADIVRSTLPRLLGPKGLMPSAKRGTVTSDISRAIREARGGLDWLGVPIGPRTTTSKAESSDKGMVSVPIARITFTEDQIKTNLIGFAKQVEDVLNGVGTQAEASTTAPNAAKKRGAIEKVILSTSKSFSVEVTDFKQMLER